MTGPTVAGPLQVPLETRTGLARHGGRNRDTYSRLRATKVEDQMATWITRYFD